MKATITSMQRTGSGLTATVRVEPKASVEALDLTATAAEVGALDLAVEVPVFSDFGAAEEAVRGAVLAFAQSLAEAVGRPGSLV
jgi:hypothetical protein